MHMLRLKWPLLVLVFFLDRVHAQTEVTVTNVRDLEQAVLMINDTTSVVITEHLDARSPYRGEQVQVLMNRSLSHELFIRVRNLCVLSCHVGRQATLLTHRRSSVADTPDTA